MKPKTRRETNKFESWTKFTAASKAWHSKQETDYKASKRDLSHHLREWAPFSMLNVSCNTFRQACMHACMPGGRCCTRR